ncbi:MAG TPA: efflux RND transporter periplasmic adaptor subunit, partial [Gammaproteobacteria bacterium]|nr:efflux RND transporter periplasmic adaptor subunit [Gammaproteobacteria bacterium]
MKNTLPVIFFIAALTVLVACSPGPAETPPVVFPVKSMVVAAEPLDQVSQYAGEVQARYEITLAFRVGGKIT